jgi:eukaryotic-like serine/threonine-protein kinase
MTQDDNKPGPPEEQDDRTVFMPSGDFPPAQTPPPAGLDDATALPPPAPSQPPVSDPGFAAAPTSQPPRDSAGSFQTTQFAPRTDGQAIQVGDVLNHIFEVKRFIARGGMGEVFEGVNVNTDERVAIKVMLPSLAADPNVISMFRKEARTLTRLQHEALVQYRVLAQEPQLGVLYIVTEYVDGTNLADVLTQTEATPEELAQLLRRLAAGLRVAHALGAIHRDMSPDNVLLEDGSLGKAKIIDFGIAKDLDPGSATIVGDGFAGKLNYVAPEQLGDFGREVGPWSDVYSLALVILAVAGKRNVQMGGSLVDAVDKRRAGPDLSAAPDALKPVLETMTKANPAERLRSMDEVLAELDSTGLTGRLPTAPPGGVPAAPGGPRKGVLIGGAIAALLVIALLGWLLMGRGDDQAQVAGGTAPAAAPTDPVEIARGAVNSVLPSVGCTWLDIVDIGREGDAVTVALTGVAGNPSAAQSEISRALAGAGINGASINFEEVSTITQSGCAALDTYRQVRAPDGQRLAVPQRKFEKRRQEGGTYAGKLAANALININVSDPKLDFALVGLEPSGVITSLITSRGEFEQLRQDGTVTDLGGDRFRLQIDADHDGWSGIMLLTGKGPFPAELIAPGLVTRGPDWTNSFVSAAAAGGWQSNMVWFKNVDEVQD